MQKRHAGYFGRSKCFEALKGVKKSTNLVLCSACMKTYIFYNRNCRSFQFLNTCMDAFSSNRPQNIFLYEALPRHFSADVPAALYRRALYSRVDDTEVSLRCLAAFMMKKLKSNVSDVQLLNLLKNA